MLTALTVTAIGIAMVFGSLWALRNSGGLIQNLTVTKKAANFIIKANLFLKSRKPAAPRRAMLIS